MSNETGRWSGFVPSTCWRLALPIAAGARLALLAGAVAAGASAARAGDVAELRVVATIKPVHALVAAVMEGVARPSVLISGNASPHTFSLKPSEARTLARADVIFRVSGDLEPFTVGLARSLPRRVSMISLADAPGMVRLPRRTGKGFERHDHGHGHGGHRGHAVPEGDTPDPHVWLDPENARAMVRAIVAALSDRAPAHADRFAANGRRLDASLAALGSELDAKLAPFAKMPLIVFHDAYQYLEHRYGLTVIGSITVNPEVAPSARRLHELRSRISREHVACILSEPQFSARIVAAVIEGSRVRSGVLDPVGGMLPAGPEHYHRTLRAMAQAIAGCRVDG
ncbi:MAG: zinc ABC transporter substrate-binding protein [Hyphomicrobiaceae bacterium]